MEFVVNPAWLAIRF